MRRKDQQRYQREYEELSGGFVDTQSNGFMPAGGLEPSGGFTSDDSFAHNREQRMEAQRRAAERQRRYDLYLKEQAKEHDQQLQTGSHVEPIPAPEASGFSWGPTMPDEENQFNFNGTYVQYFEKVFREEFPRYDVQKETSPNGKRTTFFFRDGGQVAPVVEVLSQSCDVYKHRRDCAARGIPYLRFYHDHEGWWNTRAYVVKRVGEALGA